MGTKTRKAISLLTALTMTLGLSAGMTLTARAEGPPAGPPVKVTANGDWAAKQLDVSNLTKQFTTRAEAVPPVEMDRMDRMGRPAAPGMQAANAPIAAPGIQAANAPIAAPGIAAPAVPPPMAGLAATPSSIIEINSVDDWAAYATNGVITLNAGVQLNINTHDSPATPTSIEVFGANNGINGNSGTYNNLRIQVDDGASLLINYLNLNYTGSSNAVLLCGNANLNVFGNCSVTSSDSAATIWAAAFSRITVPNDTPDFALTVGNTGGGSAIAVDSMAYFTVDGGLTVSNASDQPCIAGTNNDTGIVKDGQGTMSVNAAGAVGMDCAQLEVFGGALNVTSSSGDAISMNGSSWNYIEVSDSSTLNATSSNGSGIHASTYLGIDCNGVISTSSNNGGGLVVDGGGNFDCYGSGTLNAVGAGSMGYGISCLYFHQSGLTVNVSGGTNRPGLFLSNQPYYNAIGIFVYSGSLNLTGAPAFYCGPGNPNAVVVLNIGAAVSLTNYSSSGEIPFMMCEAGYIWSVNGAAITTGTANSNTITVSAAPGATGKITLTEPAEPVCEIGSTPYYALKDAITAVPNRYDPNWNPNGNESTTTIKLLKDITYDGTNTYHGGGDIYYRNIEFDLSGHDLIFAQYMGVIMGGTALYLYNSNVSYKGPGSFKVISDYYGLVAVRSSCELTYVETAGDNSYAVYSYGSTIVVDDGVKATGANSYGVVADVSYSYNSDGSISDILGSNITVTGGVSTTDGIGVEAYWNTSTLTVNGSVNAAFADDIIGSGVSALSGGTVIVNGDVNVTSNNSTNFAVYADVQPDDTDAAGSSVTVTGNVNASGESAWGIKALASSDVTIGGDVTVASGIPVFAVGAGTKANIAGNISSANGCGVFADEGAQVTVDGTIQADPYISIALEEKTAADYESTTTKAGYRTYTDGVSTVWVKIPKINQTTPVSVALSNNAAILGVSSAPSASATGGDGTGAYSFYSSNPSVATIDSNGAITLVGVGATQITASRAGDQTYNGSAMSAPVTLSVIPKVTLTAANTAAAGTSLADAKNQDKVTFGDISRVAGTNDFTLTVSGTAKLASYTSIDGTRDSGAWVGVLIGEQGVSDITGLWVKDSQTGSYRQLTAADGAAGMGGTGSFVYWFNAADTNAESTYTVYVATDANGANESKLTIKFVPAPKYTITASAGTGGSVTGGGTYTKNDSVTLTATASTGYSFDGWYENSAKITDAAATYTFTAASNKTLQANFKLNSPVTPVYPGGGGPSYSGGSSTTSSNTGGTKTVTNPTTPLAPKPEGFKNPYTDVADSAWYYDAVMYVTQKGVMAGTGNSKFSPDYTITRAMFAQILYNYAGKPKVTGASPFDDVKSGSWYADAVTWASGKGIVLGYGNGKFGPDDYITREQMAVLLYKFAKFKGSDVSASDDLSAYTDANKISDWARPAIQWAVSIGIIKGRTSDSIVPQGNAKRSEAATVFMQYIKLVDKGK